MCVIHALPGSLTEAEELQMTKINAKDKANQTPLLVRPIFTPLQPTTSRHTRTCPITDIVLQPQAQRG